MGAESRQFIALCRLLAHTASLHSSRMLCWFSIPERTGGGVNSILYLPPSSGQLRGVSSVAAEEEHQRGDTSLVEFQMVSRNSSAPKYSNHTSDLARSSLIAAAASRFLRREMAMASSLAPPPGGCPSEEAVHALTSARRALGFVVPALDSSSSVPLPGADPQNTTDEVNFDQMETDEVPYYSLVVIMPSVQQHCLLSLLEQGLSILTLKNPTSASFTAWEVIHVPFSLP